MHIRTIFLLASAVAVALFISAFGLRKERISQRSANVEAPPGTTMYPGSLYPGENILIFSNPAGISTIRAILDESMKSIVTIDPVEPSYDCADSVRVHVTINSGGYPVNARFVVTDCRKRRKLYAPKFLTWHLDRIEFPVMHVGETRCEQFRIDIGGVAGGIGVHIDSITCSVPGVSFDFDQGPQPPMHVEPNSIYKYRVCFTPTEPGDYEIPVMSWNRRPEPVGELTTYPVGDTAIVHVRPLGAEAPSTGDGPRHTGNDGSL